MPVVIDLLSSSPEERVAPKTKATAKLPAKALSYEATRPLSNTWTWAGLSSDSIEALLVSNAPTTKPSTALTDKKSTNSTKKSASLAHQDDFHVLSDDPFESSPPAKRRRLSSSPQARPSKTTVPKATGYKRSISNIESSTRIAGSRVTAAPILKRTAKTNTIFEDDIVFTSSPDYVAEAARKRKGKKRESWESDEDDELPPLSGIRNHNGNKPNTYTIEDEDSDGYGSALAQRSKKGSTASKLSTGNGFLDHEFSSDIELPSRPAEDPPKTSKGSSQSALEKYNKEKAKEKAAKERAEKAKEKTATKEAEKKQKQLEKEEKARKKEQDAEIAKANMRRTDKKISIKEMIVDLPSCLNSRVTDQIRTFLGSKDAEHTEFESTLPVVKWRRNTDREYNEEMDRWDAVPRTIKPENFVMCVLLAKDFVELVTGGEGQDLNAHVLKLKTKFESCKIIYLIEGFMAWMRKNRNTKDKQFKEAVRSYLPQEEPTASQRRKKKDAEYVDEDLVEDALLNLQVVHDTLIHHTNAPNETAEWVVNFTEQISLRPEKLQNLSLDTTFCMESGQVKTGENPTDTYVKMLQEMTRITQPVAWGIVAEYPTVQKLVKGLEENGPSALAECRKSANGNGSFTDQKVGKAISRRVYKVFTDRDPASTDIGLQHGRQLASKIRSQIVVYEAMFKQTSKLDWAAVRDIAQQYSETILKLTPELHTEIAGIAEGAGLDLLDIVALNARSEIALGSFSDGCTSVAWKTKNEGVILSQNWDWTARVKKNLALMSIEQPGKPKIWMVTEAGIVGKIGFNSASVGTCLNAIRAKPSDATKLPIHIVLRLFLQSTSTKSAISKFEALGGVASACHILLADKSGPISLELSPLGNSHIFPNEKGIVCHSNHFIENKCIKEPFWLTGSTIRLDRARKLTDELAEGVKPVTAELLRRHVFSDTFNAPQAICCQEDPIRPIETRSSTLFNIIMRFEEGKVPSAEVVWGKPGSGEEGPVLRMPW
ncbi:hypothetical protein EG329_010273 [Mollisiaceae sp. DMI_Dod_QoI]|nr:hypothetical protein EG329_010273 [Helotiales sp. DMI_Dod_QoI]